MTFIDSPVFQCLDVFQSIVPVAVLGQLPVCVMNIPTLSASAPRYSWTLAHLGTPQRVAVAPDDNQQNRVDSLFFANRKWEDPRKRRFYRDASVTGGSSE
ncbi:hypothetical protein [Rhodopirellula sallentina]|uniref:hypothetical protein n=1 Tax=Rhodopirellula sallentina TaxID=1263869 RepID=UPI0011819422|nr:hypothetical protein [Rhodopirellula sallentina]